MIMKTMFWDNKFSYLMDMANFLLLILDNVLAKVME